MTVDDDKMTINRCLSSSRNRLKSLQFTRWNGRWWRWWRYIFNL